MDKIISIANEIKDEIINLRRDFHMYPELSKCEMKTSETIASYLEGLGLDVEKNIGGYGVVALLRGEKEGKTVALRADMDALPIKELNDFEYKSKIDGVMHACGHDAHMAILLGACNILVKLKEEIHGNVKFIFQPAEENAPTGGANFMINDGALKNPDVDAIFGLHVWPDIREGKIGIKSGGMMASSDPFSVTIKGKASHAATPNQGLDAVFAGAQFVNLIQSIVSRRTDPRESAVITIGTFNAGVRYNVLAEEAKLAGTCRTLNKDVRDNIEKNIRNILDGVCGALGLEGELNFNYGYPALVNDGKLVNLVRTAASYVFDEKNIIEPEKSSMAGEDFAFYLEHIPGAFVWLGCGKDESDNPPLHNPNFNINEDILAAGSALMTRIAIEYLNKYSGE